MEQTVRILKAASDESRLRFLVLCTEGDFTVSDLVQIVGQSQPRVSRNLKILCDAGLLDRVREGNWVFYRLVKSPEVRRFVAQVISLISSNDTVLKSDRLRLNQIKAVRLEKAEEYFAGIAAEWEGIRALHVGDMDVETVLRERVSREKPTALLDIGTGTGRILEILAPFISDGEGIDFSHGMLTIARANLDKPGLGHCRVRHGNMYQLPYDDDSFDYVTLHQVLHFADQPNEVVSEISRVLKPGGTASFIDFASHDLEQFRDDYQHRRLGFSDNEVHGLMEQFNMTPEPPISFPGTELTVSIWSGSKN